MAKIVLTDRFIKSRKPAPKGKRIDCHDSVTPGLGLRISDTGRKVFYFRGRVAGQHDGRLTIGEYGAITLDAARQKAREWQELRRTGKNPKAEEARQRDAEVAAEARKHAHVFRAVVEAYIAQKAVGPDPRQPLQRDGKDVARDLRGEFVNDRVTERDGKPVLRKGLGDRPVASITEDDIRQVIDDAKERSVERAKKRNEALAKALGRELRPNEGERGSGDHARNLLGYAKTLFEWVVANKKKYGVTENPCAGLLARKVLGKKKARKRVLSDKEIRAVWWAAERLGYPYGPITRLLLLVGARTSVVTDGRRAELELHRCDPLWSLSPERMKTEEPHTIPLVGAALDLIKACPKFERGDYLFSRDGGRSPVVLTNKVKRRLDALVFSLMQDIAREQGENPALVELKPFVWHDLRRTFRTRLSSVEVSSDTAEALMAHVPEGIKGTYNLHKFDAQKRRALGLWEEELRRIVGTDPGRPENVVSFTSRVA